MHKSVAVALTLVAALALVFYSGASRGVEIGLFVALVLLLGWTLQFNRAPRPSEDAPAKRVDARQFVCWLFAYMSYKYVVISVQIARHHRYALRPVWYLATVILYAIVPIVSGIAWWTAWRRKPMATGWGIAASVMYLLIFLEALVFFPRLIGWHYVNVLIAGIAGILAILPSGKQNERNAPAASVSA